MGSSRWQNREQRISRKRNIKEVKEETGIVVQKNNFSQPIKCYVVEEKYSFVWYMFRAKINKTKVKIKNDEHNEYFWLKPLEALMFDLALEEDFCIRHVFSI